MEIIKLDLETAELATTELLLGPSDIQSCMTDEVRDWLMVDALRRLISKPPYVVACSNFHQGYLMGLWVAERERWQYANNN